MKKFKKKVLFMVVVIISAVVISINVGNSNQKNELLSLLSMDNIEALADESGGFDCYLYNTTCKFTVTVYAQLPAVNKLLKKIGLTPIGIGGEANLTNATALYSTTAPKNGGVKVRCGTDLTCAQLIQSL